jgi:hypothetical protein
MSLWDTISGTVKKAWTPTTWTDAIGLTDSKAGQRGLEAMGQGIAATSQQLDQSMQPILDMYGNASAGRQMGDVLDAYRENMAGLENAGSAENVESYLNPMYGRAIQNATNQALAGAGSSLQSSAANNAVANAVANTSTDMWNTAFNQALADATNNKSIYGSIEQSDLMPSMQYGQLASDIAGTKYTAGMDLAQAMGNTAGQNMSWFGNLF